MKTLSLASRNSKEILRDPLNLSFGIGFPVVLILLLSMIQARIPVPLFEIQTLAPGIVVFGLSFITLFSATLISKDRSSSLLQRLYTTPLSPFDFIASYTLPIIPMALLQSTLCYAFALIFKLPISVNILYAVLLTIPISLLYIGLGLLFGSILTDKQVGGICGGALTNLSAWLSGAWFDLELVGGGFKKVANALPFVHAVELERAALNADWAGVSRHIWWVLGYGCVLLILAVSLFLRQMKRQ